MGQAIYNMDNKLVKVCIVIDDLSSNAAAWSLM